jgi:hypothetical protein
MQKATTFEHGGKVYEVRAIPTLNGWKVRIFVEGIPANEFTAEFSDRKFPSRNVSSICSPRTPRPRCAGLGS